MGLGDSHTLRRFYIFSVIYTDMSSITESERWTNIQNVDESE